MTNSTLLDLAIILGIFHLLTNYLHFYICVCVCVYVYVYFRHLQLSSLPTVNVYPLLMRKNTRFYIILWLLNFQGTNGFSTGLVCECVCMNAGENFCKSVRLSSNTWTHKNMFFANISLCDYFSWNWFQHYGYSLHNQGFNSEIFLT